MGILVDGVWKDEWHDTKSTDGRFVRWELRHRNWITPDGSPRPSRRPRALSSVRASLLASNAIR
jgi:glutathionyl-hydroquinone reductase